MYILYTGIYCLLVQSNTFFPYRVKNRVKLQKRPKSPFYIIPASRVLQKTAVQQQVNSEATVIVDAILR